MQIRIRQTGQVVTDQEFRAMFSNTGFPVQLTEEIINDFGGDVVLEGPQAQPTRYQVGFRDGVVQIDGKWHTKHSVSEMDDEAKATLDARQADFVRSDRNQRLKDSDWTQGKDMPDNISTVWATYRQALRDVPQQAGFPWDVQWPQQPE